jgi:hypothetical protein
LEEFNLEIPIPIFPNEFFKKYHFSTTGDHSRLYQIILNTINQTLGMDDPIEMNILDRYLVFRNKNLSEVTLYQNFYESYLWYVHSNDLFERSIQIRSKRLCNSPRIRNNHQSDERSHCYFKDNKSS